LIPPDISLTLDRARDRLGIFAGGVAWYEEVSSTNDVAVQMAEHRPGEGIIVVANAQSSGRGRLGRTWASPPGAGLYVSVVLRPPESAVSLLTLAAGVALTEGIEAATGLAPVVKWPNDLMLSGRKLAGILAEGRVQQSGAPFIVLGFGINLLTAAYPAEIAARATSLEAELGRPVDRGLVLAECLAALAERYAQLTDGAAHVILDAWRARARPMLRRMVEWEQHGRMRRGTAVDVDERGALLVTTGDTVERVISGEVRWLEP
jgi:BirA family transcriptional regulator, biotin operon repressor / biotin---[acetyl-CoA-carboxylase] ligase